MLEADIAQRARTVVSGLENSALGGAPAALSVEDQGSSSTSRRTRRRWGGTGAG